ncbi:MAG TPA: chemotaxis protein CheW [Bdellovibrio sp.]|nr:chemotaxis protein CheW [Bdellovibrio sp.]
MSDFFGDDFTAELKGYYLESLLKELQKFIDLLDEGTLKRVRAEIREQCPSWSVNAKSNEFEFFSRWLESFFEKLDLFATSKDLISALKTAKKYVETLQSSKKDTAEYAAQFALTAESQSECLYLHCKIAAQEFVIPIKNVVEIIASLPLHPLPNARPGLAGVIPFRGDAIPVYCLQDFGFQKNEKLQSYYVICEYEGTRFSLQVTETDELIKLRDKDLQAIDSSSVIHSAPFIHQFFVKDQRSIMVLDIERLVAA